MVVVGPVGPVSWHATLQSVKPHVASWPATLVYVGRRCRDRQDARPKLRLPHNQQRRASILTIQCSSPSGIPSRTGISLTQRSSRTPGGPANLGDWTRRKHCSSTAMFLLLHAAIFDPVRPLFPLGNSGLRFLQHSSSPMVSKPT